MLELSDLSARRMSTPDRTCGRDFAFPEISDRQLHPHRFKYSLRALGESHKGLLQAEEIVVLRLLIDSRGEFCSKDCRGFMSLGSAGFVQSL